MSKLSDAIANAMTEEPTVEDTADAEVQAPEATPTPDSSGEQEADVEVEDSAVDASEGLATDDVPTEYFGVDLSSLPAEVRSEIIRGYQERDKFIQQLLQRSDQDMPGQPAAVAEEQAPQQVTDEDILAALGINTEDDPFAENTAKVAVPLARLVLDQQAKLDALLSKTEVAETGRYWHDQLDVLERQYGALPKDITRDALIKYAAENSIAEPMDAYWRLMGPARKALLDEVETKRRALESTLKKQGGAASTRPKVSAETVPTGPESKNVKDAVGEVFRKLAAERGMDLRT